MVVSSLEKIHGANLSWVIDADNDNVLDGKPRIRIEVAIIIDKEVKSGEVFVATPKEVATALIRAAKATGVK